MPIGIVTDDALQQEMDRLNGSTIPRSQRTPGNNGSIIHSIIPKPGRKDGDVNVPDSLRKIIGETSVIDGRQAALDLAESFGISASSVSAYAKGATSTTSYDTPSQSIISHINRSRQRAVKKAQKTLNQALGSLTQEKLDNTDARDLSGIAKDMSVIIRNLEPAQAPTDNDDNGIRGPQFTIYAPQFRDERSFETIVVKE